MARLKMVPDLYSEDIAEAKFPYLRSEGQPPKILTRLELLRNDYQERVLREKEQKVLTLMKHKSRASPPHSEIKHFYDPNKAPISHMTPWAAEEKNWASNWTVSKKSAGIDRAHPLKPVVHRKSPAYISPESVNLHRSPSANVNGVKHALPFPGNIRSKSGSSRAEPWHELQKTEFSLEAEIRRKEALLQEKLRRTQEELRRIQKEKEEAELTDRSVKEVKEGLNRVGKINRRPAKPSQYHNARSELEEKDLRYTSNPVRRKPLEDSSHHTDPLNRIPSPPFTAMQYAIGRLKREKLAGGENAGKAPVVMHAEHSHGALSLKTLHIQADEHPEFQPGTKQETEEELPAHGLEDSNGGLVPCQLCGRRFMIQRLAKHAEVCKKMQNSKRKVFDSSKARAKGTDLEQYMHQKGRTTSNVEQQVRDNTWRQKHESFMRTIRQAREVQNVLARGGKLSDLPPPPPEENPDYITCPHCNRRFAPRAAERHIPKCETIKSKPRPPPSRRR
ncbi:zinc finger C2HC domain-containing protein 1C [Pelodytes ibericus]